MRYFLCTSMLEPVENTLWDKTSAPYNLRGCSVCLFLPTIFHLMCFKGVLSSLPLWMCPHLICIYVGSLILDLCSKSSPVFSPLTSRQLEYTACCCHVNFRFSTSIVQSLHTTNRDISGISVTLLTFLMASSCLHQRA